MRQLFEATPQVRRPVGPTLLRLEVLLAKMDALFEIPHRDCQGEFLPPDKPRWESQMSYGLALYTIQCLAGGYGILATQEHHDIAFERSAA